MWVGRFRDGEGEEEDIVEVGRVQKEKSRGDEKGDVSDCARALKVGRAVVLNPRMTGSSYMCATFLWQTSGKLKPMSNPRGTIFYF